MATEAYPALTDKELAQIWDRIYQSAKVQAPSGVMFSTAVRANGIQLLADHGYAEGVEVAVEMLRQEGWGHHKRNPAAFKTLETYGGGFQESVPKLKAMFAKKKKTKGGQVAGLEEALERLQQAAKESRQLKHLNVQ